MMMVPAFFHDTLADRLFQDDFFDLPLSRYFQPEEQMQTDVKETPDAYELQMNLPGVKKEDIQAELKDGYLTVTASRGKNEDAKDSAGNYLRRERFSGSQSRSFYVGEDVKQEDIHAKYENGILTLRIAKPSQEVIPKKTYIAID